LARPGGTITGLSIAEDEAFAGKLLELVKETLSKTARVGVIWNPANPSHVAAEKEIARLATKLGLPLSPCTPQRPADIARRSRRAKTEDALLSLRGSGRSLWADEPADK